MTDNTQELDEVAQLLGIYLEEIDVDVYMPITVNRQTLAHILDWHQQEIAKARIDEVKKARDDYTTRVPDVFDRDIYQVKYFQYRNEELTAELSQTLKEHKEAEL